MSKNVLVALADNKFLNQAKQLFSTVFWNSGWSGDYLLLAYETEDSDLGWFFEKGIKVKHCAPLDCGSNKIGDKITACKCYLFTEYFRQWDNIVYLDVDIVTRGSLQGLADLPGFSACFSLGQSLKDNFINMEKMPKNLSDEIFSNFDLNVKAFNSGVMAFPSSIIHKNMFADILEIFKKYVLFGLFGGDQLPFNIYFYKKWNELPLAYNQITPLDNHAYNIKKLQGIIIHCVSFGNGPWNEHSLLYKEWKNNFGKADFIDLNNIPKVQGFTPDEINKRSESVIKTDLLGGSMNINTILNMIGRVGKLVFTDPTKIIKKIKLLGSQ
jgi:lipopolysaccharide biosynthesis glycosyltransferase